MKKVLWGFIFTIFWTSLNAQFAGPVGSPNTTAIKADSNIFVAWAMTCNLNRGWTDIRDKSKGKASLGFDYNANGKAEGFVVSLGDSGVATLTFAKPIYNGPSWDFAVFENSFSSNFLELAFVEVSSDGQRFVRFPATSNYPDSNQIGPFDEVSKAELINNLAGKYKGGYGTPFDLEELKDSSGLNINRITHVRIIDCIGSVSDSFASHDINGNAINDPFPTPFTSSGFDLDAVGVIHSAASTSQVLKPIRVWPNPANSVLNFPFYIEDLKIYNPAGQIVMEKPSRIKKVSTRGLHCGMYFFKAYKSQSIVKGTFTVER